MVGANGQFGSALSRSLRAAGHAVLETTRRGETVTPERTYLDLGALEGWAPPPGVTTAYLCAGITSLERCELEPVETRRINVAAQVALARKLAGRGAALVFFSTNQVFDGSVPQTPADAPLRPWSVYGRQKAEVEEALLALPVRVAILRLAKVFVPGTPLLVRWVRDLRAGRPVDAYSDLVIAPVPVGLVLAAVARIAEARAAGIFQLSADRDVSYADVARHLARRVGAPDALVRPTTTRAAGADRPPPPPRTTLDTTRLRKELGLCPPDVWQVVDQAAEVSP